MAALTGTTDSYSLVGKAEDVEDAIFDISPTETPVLTMAKRKKATATLHQWQTDALAAAASNKAVEGDDATFASATPTALLSNYTQISKKTVMVSRTTDTIRKYGRAKELARLVTKYGKELKRDIEFQIVSAAGSSAGNATTPRASAGIGAMIVNRVFAGTAANTAGTVPGYAGGVFTAPTAGTAGTFVEDNLKDALEAAWTDGGNPEIILTNSKNKRRMAAFAGASAFQGFQTTNNGKEQGGIVGGVDVYISDYGNHKVVLDRYMVQSAVYCVDPEYVSVAWLDPIQIQDLAKTGDAEKKHMVCEWTLVLENPDAHAQIRDAIAT
jgi:hypothetical protein